MPNPKPSSKYPNAEAYIQGLIKAFPEKYGQHTVNDYIDMMEKIAKVESQNKNVRQMGGGPGRGYFQVEERTAPVALQRLKNIAKEIKGKGIEVPELTNFNKDFTNLSKDEQMTYAFANMVKAASAKRTPENPNLYINPKQSKDMWLKYHWAGKEKDVEDRTKHWLEIFPEKEQPLTEKKQLLSPVKEKLGLYAQAKLAFNQLAPYIPGAALINKLLPYEQGGPVYNWIPPNYPRVGARNEQGGWLDQYENGSWVTNSSIPTPITPSFYPAGKDRTLTNYQMGTPKSNLPIRGLRDATPNIPAYGYGGMINKYAAGATVWTKQDTPLWAAGTPTPTSTQNFRNDRSLNTDRYKIGDVIPTGMDYKSPAAGTYDYSKDIQPYHTMRLHAPDTTRMAYGGYVPKYGFGSTVGDIGKLFVNTMAAPAEQVTGNNFVNFNYANKGIADAAAVSEGILGAATDIVGTTFGGPLYGMAKGQLQGITKNIGSSTEEQRGANKWANKTGQITSSAGNLIAGVASGNLAQTVGGAGELLGTTGGQLGSKELSTVGQLGSLGSSFINPQSTFSFGKTGTLAGAGDLVSSGSGMMAKHGGRITKKYNPPGLRYQALNPGVSAPAGIYTGPTTQRGITFADGGEIDITKPYLNPATVQATLASATKPVTNTLGRVISTPASREKERREKIIAKDPSKYSIEDYKQGIKEPGADNSVLSDPIAMAAAMTAGSAGLGAIALSQVPRMFATNLASEATFGLTDLTRAGLKGAAKQLGSSNALNLEELRRTYHNSKRFLNSEERRFLHKHGHGLRENYRTSNSVWNNQQNQILSDEQLNTLIVQHNNELPPPPSEIQFMPDGTTRTVYNQQPITDYVSGSYRPDYIDLRRPINGHAPGTLEWNRLNDILQTWRTVDNTVQTAPKPKIPINKSGLTKEEVLQKASAKDKDVISKMSETEFENTVLKPNGEIAPYKPGTELEQMTYDLGNRRLKLKDAIEMSEKEYADAFNENLDLLNDIIAQKNKSGVEYRVKGLDESGRLTFHTPEQNIPVNLTDKQKANVEWFNRDPEDWLKNKAGLKQEGNKWKMSDEAGGEEFNSIDEAIEFVKNEMKPLTEPKIISGESTWGVKLNPGQWRGNVEDIANTEYFRSIPGLEMSNTTSGVFSDNIARKGTGAYESINEYLKRLDLGRVKPGFNSQTEFSRGAWENFIKSGRGVGFYANPRTVYGTMKSIFPYVGAGYLGYEGLQETGALQQSNQKKNGGWLDNL